MGTSVRRSSLFSEGHFSILSFSHHYFAAMKLTSTLICLVLLYCKLSLSVRVVKLGGKDCTYKGEKICNGAVTKEIGKKLVKVCKNGKVKTATRKSVGEGFPLVGRDTGEGKDCIWYGTTFCDGDVVEDLYRWWFKMKCSKTRFSVDSSSWAEVIKRKQQEQMKDIK